MKTTALIGRPRFASANENTFRKLGHARAVAAAWFDVFKYTPPPSLNDPFALAVIFISNFHCIGTPELMHDLNQCNLHTQWKQNSTDHQIKILTYIYSIYILNKYIRITILLVLGMILFP